MQVKVHPMGDYQTNCYVVTLDGKDFIIDPGIGALTWLKEVVKNPVAVLNTHGHFDHIWSNQEVKEFFKVKLYTPKNDEFMLTLNPYGLGMPSSYADVLVNEDEELIISGIKVKFHYFPGHTPGCSVIEINDTLFSGDFIFKGTIGRFDFPNSNSLDMKNSLNKVLKWEKDYDIYPGHGGKTTLKQELANIKQWEKHIQ